jgi:hypothetical protein
MTHKITIQEALTLTNELTVLIQKSMPLRAKYHLNKLYDVIKVEKEKLNEFINPYFDLDKFGELNEETNQTVIKKEHHEEYFSIINEYLSIEIEITFKSEFDLFSQVVLNENENFPTFYNLFNA